MRLFNKLRTPPEDRLQNRFYAAIPHEMKQDVLADSIYASALAARHTADRVVGEVVTKSQTIDPEVDYGQWLEVQDEVMEFASRGVRVGFLIGRNLLSQEAPEAILNLNLSCGEEF